MKITFINPPSPRKGWGVYREECCLALLNIQILPAMIAWLAGIARQKHDVKIIDMCIDGMSYDDLKAEDVDADLVVFSASVHLFTHDMRLSKVVKRLNPKVKIAVMVFPPVLKDHVMKNYPIDYYLEIPRHESLMKLIGVDKDAPSAFDLLPVEKYGIVPCYPGINCPFGCIFCAWNKKKPMYRDVEIFLEEFRYLAKRAKSDEIYFLHPNFLYDMDYVKRFCQKIDFDVKWHVDGRVDRRDKEVFRLMKEKGCHVITFGVECATQEGLERIKKNIKLEWVKEAVKNCHEVGMKARLTFIFGFPWGTNKEKEAILKLLQETNPSGFGINPPFPYENTELYQMVKPVLREKFKDNIEMYESWHKNKDRAIFPTKTLSIDQIEAAKKEIKMKFYLGRKRKLVKEFLRGPSLEYVRRYLPSFIRMVKG